MNYQKRVFDLVISSTCLLLAGPLLLIISILEIIIHGKPVFFIQQRPGWNARPFGIYKFRTMTNECDASGNLLPDEKRLTAFGRFLRATSLDELPEIINVIQGDMSLVGPRPLLTKYLDLYTPEQARRHSVRPGITGWAQINGRNALTWEDKFKLDVWYVDNYSFCLDLKILAVTVWKIIKREGINQPGLATVEEFKGTGKSR